MLNDDHYKYLQSRTSTTLDTCVNTVLLAKSSYRCLYNTYFQSIADTSHLANHVYFHRIINFRYKVSSPVLPGVLHPISLFFDSSAGFKYKDRLSTDLDSHYQYKTCQGTLKLNCVIFIMRNPLYWTPLCWIPVLHGEGFYLLVFSVSKYVQYFFRSRHKNSINKGSIRILSIEIKITVIISISKKTCFENNYTHDISVMYHKTSPFIRPIKALPSGGIYFFLKKLSSKSRPKEKHL